MTRFAKTLLSIIILIVLVIVGLSYFTKSKKVDIVVNEQVPQVEQPVPIENVSHFTDSDKTFTFDYNSSFTTTQGDKIPTTNWSVNAQDKGILLAQVVSPEGYILGTNFRGVKFTIGRSTDAKIIKSCTDTTGVINQENKEGILIQTTVSGYPFVKFTTAQGAAGNFYETTSYRGIFDGDCYAIEYTIHSTNIGNYSPDQGIKEFDKTKIVTEMENIIKSFKFLISSN